MSDISNICAGFWFYRVNIGVCGVVGWVCNGVNLTKKPAPCGAAVITLNMALCSFIQTCNNQLWYMKHFIIIPVSILIATGLGAVLSAGLIFKTEQFNLFAWLCFVSWYVLVPAVIYAICDEKKASTTA